MNLPDQAVRQRETLSQAPQTVLESSHVVGHLAHIVKRSPGRFSQLEEKKIRQGRLRAFDLGGEHRFLSHIGVPKERLVRQECCDTVEASQSDGGCFKRLLQ